MAELKVIAKLEVGVDGRTAENYNSYSVQVENALSGIEKLGVYLDDVLRNRGDATALTPPGDSAEWVAAAPGRNLAGHAAAEAAYRKWSRLNRITHSHIT